jgi:hypothetical protein
VRVRGLASLLLESVDLPNAGRCMSRLAPGRIYATFHDRAPAGVSLCPICGQLVIRARGRWWER